MKYLLIGICMCTVILFISSCKKSSSGRTIDSNSLTGIWELKKVGTSWVPNVPGVAGKGNRLKFTATTYQLYTEGVLVKSGTYQTEKDSTVEQNVCLIFKPGEYGQRISYSDSTNFKIFFQLTKDTLSFQTGCYAVDGGRNDVYERVNDDN